MRVRWDGPTGAVNRDVGRASGHGDALVHGMTYEVPDELGERLTSAGWARVTNPRRRPRVIYDPPTPPAPDDTPAPDPPEADDTQAEAPSPPADDPKGD